jgi:hypothetical protein
LTRKQESPQAGFPARFEQARNGREVATSNGHNSFVILGANWGGPAHYVGQLTLDGKVLLSMTFGLPSTPNGVVASWVAEITVS